MRNLQYIICFFLLLLGGAVYLSLKFSFIGSDAPYYLSVARDISSGLIPYKDIYLSYTPVAMYLNAAVFEFFGDFEFSRFLFFQYMLIFAGGFLLYSISAKYIHLKKQKAVFLSILLVFAVLSSDGNDVILEVYSFLFVLLGLLFFFKEKLFWTGFFLGLSFFCKQYGLLNFIPFFLLFLLEKNQAVFKISKLSAGAVVPLLLFILYFVGYQDVSFISLFSQLNGAQYLSYSFFSWGSLLSYLIGAKVFVLLVIPILLYQKILKDRLNTFLLVGVFVNLLPLLLQAFQHYYINTFPFLFILIGRAWVRGRDRIVVYHTVSAFLIAGLFYLRIIRYGDRSEAQEIVSQSAEKMLPQDNEVFLNGDLRYLYLMNNYRNPVVSEIGYSYPYKPDRAAMDSIRVLSGSEFPGTSQKIMKVQDDYLYLYFPSNENAED